MRRVRSCKTITYCRSKQQLQEWILPLHAKTVKNQNGRDNVIHASPSDLPSPLTWKHLLNHFPAFSLRLIVSMTADTRLWWDFPQILLQSNRPFHKCHKWHASNCRPRYCVSASSFTMSTSRSLYDPHSGLLLDVRLIVECKLLSWKVRGFWSKSPNAAGSSIATSLTLSLLDYLRQSYHRNKDGQSYTPKRWHTYIHRPMMWSLNFSYMLHLAEPKISRMHVGTFPVRKISFAKSTR